MKQITSLSKITSYLDKMMEDDINDTLLRIIEDMKKRIPQELPDILKMSNQYKELINANSDIYTQIGNENIEKDFESIFTLLSTVTSENIEFIPCKIRNGEVSSGYLEINIIPDDFKQVLEADFSKFISEKGFTVPWFGWLVQAEKSEYNPIIHGYRISYSFPEKSRTDGAIMLKAGALSWSLPPDYTGTTRKNFITEVIDAQQIYLEKIFLESVEKYGS